MRYKQDLAKFLPIADGARLIQERAGITEDEARKDIVLAVQDYALTIRCFSVSRGERHQYYASDLPHGFLVNLTPDDFDWEKSIARHRGVGHQFTAEIEVKRDQLSRMCSLLDDGGDREGSTIDAIFKPDGTPGSTAEASVPRHQYRTHLLDVLEEIWSDIDASDWKTSPPKKASIETDLKKRFSLSKREAGMIATMFVPDNRRGKAKKG